MQAFKKEYTSNPLRDLRRNIYIDGGQLRVRKKRRKIFQFSLRNPIFQNLKIQIIHHYNISGIKIEKALAREQTTVLYLPHYIAPPSFLSLFIPPLLFFSHPLHIMQMQSSLGGFVAVREDVPSSSSVRTTYISKSQWSKIL